MGDRGGHVLQQGVGEPFGRRVDEGLPGGASDLGSRNVCLHGPFRPMPFGVT